ncbi:adenosylcobinamide-phosphate synthase CbiB [Elusimicrobiota bacterium]
MKQIVIIITGACILDMILGDPRWFPHPVRLAGFLIKKLELPFRKIFKDPKTAGFFFSIVIITFTGGASYCIIWKLTAANIYIGTAASVLLVYASISVKGLKDETIPVYNELKNGDINAARKKLSMVVGRDTEDLNKEGIIKAAVETIAENTNDGIIAPLFFAFIGGAPLALIYKVINTLDSMVGYKNEQYMDFGWFSAKLDDIINFIPSRICGFLISFSSFVIPCGFINSFKIMLRDGRSHPSPNSGVSEAAMAGALGIKLGGGSFYRGVFIDKPCLGADRRNRGIDFIRDALMISFITSLLMVGLVVIMFSVVYYL